MFQFESEKNLKESSELLIKEWLLKSNTKYSNLQSLTLRLRVNIENIFEYLLKRNLLKHRPDVIISAVEIEIDIPDCTIYHL